MAAPTAAQLARFDTSAEKAPTVVVSNRGVSTGLSQDEIARAYAEGAAVPEDSRVPVRAPSGAYGTVSVSGLQNAIRSGYKVATEAQVEQYDKEERYGTTGQQLITAAEGAADVALLGTYAPLAASAAGIGADDPRAAQREAAAAIRARGEINPGSRMAGEVGGIVLAELLSRGAATGEVAGIAGGSRALRLARGVGETATVLPRLASMGGRVAETAVADALAGTRLAATPGGRVLARALASTAGGAAESLPYAIGHAVTEYDRNPNATAERILAGIGLETLAGGLAGGIFGGGGAALGEGTAAARGAVSDLVQKLRPQDIEAVAARRFGVAAEGIGDKAVELSSVISGGDRNAIRSLVTADGEGLLSAEARRRRALAVYEAPEVRNRAVESVRSNLDELLAVTEMVSDEARGAVKTSHIKRLVDDADHVRAIAGAKDEIAALRSRVEGMMADKDAFGETKRLRDVLAAVSVAERRVDDASRGFGASYRRGGLGDDGIRDATANTFAALDGLKRQIGRSRNTNGAMIPSGRDGATLGALEELYEGMRVNLEDTTRWGQAGAAQREINAKWAEMLGIQRQFRETLTRNVGRSERNPWVDAYRVDPEKAARYIDNLTNPEKDLIHGFVKKYTSAAQDLVQRIETNYELPASMAGMGDRARGAVGGMQSALADAEGAIVLRNQLRDLTASEGSGLGGAAVLGMAGSMLGGEDLGTPLGILGAAAGLLASPGKGIRRLAALERIMGNVRRKLDGGIVSHVRAITSGASAPRLLRARDAAAGIARAAGAAASASARRAATYTSVAEANRVYTRTRDDIAEAQSDPVAFRQRVEQSLAPIAESVPGVVKATGERAGIAMAFLASKLPQPRSRDLLTPHLDDPKPPADELLKFARYVNAVKDPSVLVEELERGTLTAETVEAVRAVYPEVYSEIRQSVMAELADSRRTIPYQEKTRLALLLGIKPDATFDAAFGQRLQQPTTPTEGSGGGAAKPSRGGGALKGVASSYETTLNRLEI